MRRKKKKEDIEPSFAVDLKDDAVMSEKEQYLELYDRLNSLGIRSISDLENLIANAE